MISKKLKIILLIVGVISIVGFSGYNYVMYGGVRDLSSEKTAFNVTAENITAEFNTNIDASNKKYLEKPIAISGIATSITKNEVIINNSIICNLKNPNNAIQKNEKIIVKGRFVGYDDLMSELKLDQCLIIK